MRLRRPKVPNLPLLVKRRLLRAGVSHMVMQSDPPEFEWPTLPLRTDLNLAGQPLDPYLRVRTRRSLEQLTDVYEEFIDEFWRGKRGKRSAIESRLAEKLKILPHIAAALFAVPEYCQRGQRSHTIGAVISLTALIMWNFEHEVEHAEDRFVVTAGGRRFGVDCGYPISERYSVKITRASILRGRGGYLMDLPREPDRWKHPHQRTADRLRAWVERARLPDQDALVLALGILRARYTNGCRGVGEAILALPTQGEVRSALALARRYDEYDEPMKTLHGLLVPDVITSDQFRGLFGAHHQVVLQPVATRWRHKWDVALDKLEEELLGSAIKI